MKLRKYIYLFPAVMLLGCQAQKKKDVAKAEAAVSNPEEIHAEQDPMLLGLQKREALLEAPYNQWYEANYEAYKPDQEILEKLEPLVTDIEITLFMGTWCEDSQREVPAFFKLLDALDYPQEKLTLITVNEEKTTPEKFEEGLEITNVPTIIFKRNGEEINRIVEFPMETLEEDMLKILSGKKYKHAYDW